MFGVLKQNKVEFVGVSENKGTLFEALIIRILLFGVLYSGSHLSGNSHIHPHTESQFYVTCAATGDRCNPHLVNENKPSSHRFPK